MNDGKELENLYPNNRHKPIVHAIGIISMGLWHIAKDIPTIHITDMKHIKDFIGFDIYITPYVSTRLNLFHKGGFME